MDAVPVLFIVFPFWITLGAQLLCCFRVKHKLLRHWPVLICVPCVIPLAIHLFNVPASGDASLLPGLNQIGDAAYSLVTYLYIFAVVTSVTGYGVAWMIYGVSRGARGRKRVS